MRRIKFSLVFIHILAHVTMYVHIHVLVRDFFEAFVLELLVLEPP